MSLSRVESRRQQQKQEQHRSKKRRRAGIINLCLAVLILIGLAFIFQYDRIENMYERIAGKSKSEQELIHIVQNPYEDSGAPVQDEQSEAGDVEVEDTTEVDEGGSGDASVTDPSSDGAEGDNQPPDAPAEPSEEAVIQLAFVGDILQGEYINSYLEKEGYSYPYEQALFHLTSADITAGNLEMPITRVDAPADKTYVFRGKPEALTGIVEAGIDIVSLANNHTLDHGIEGLLDTRKYLDEYGIAHVGAGNNAEEAYAVAVK
ncbi:CapA family protein [Escherichia coli]|nr:CapA family protein [Escherichia coli]